MKVQFTSWKNILLTLTAPGTPCQLPQLCLIWTLFISEYMANTNEFSKHVELVKSFKLIVMTGWTVDSNFPLLSLPFPNAGKLRHGRTDVRCWLEGSGPNLMFQEPSHEHCCHLWEVVFYSAAVLSSVSTCVCQQLRLPGEGPHILSLSLSLISGKCFGWWREWGGCGRRARPQYMWRLVLEWNSQRGRRRLLDGELI